MSFQDNVMATCRDCGTYFFRAETETWKTRCVDCFKAAKAKQVERADIGLSAYWQRRAAELEAELAGVNMQLIQQAKNIQVLTGQLSAKSSGPQWLVAELREQIRRLMQLVHPDKHGNSESATIATRWLLEVRNRL